MKEWDVFYLDNFNIKKKERGQRASGWIILDVERHSTLMDMYRIDMFAGNVIGFASCK